MSDYRKPTVARHVCPESTCRRMLDLDWALHDCDFVAIHGGFGAPPGTSDLPNVDEVDRGHDVAITLLEGEPAWGMAVNGDEYRGPIFYCPYCGERLDAPIGGER